ncbi:hypothetical protein HYZ70_00015 [Candidatus Curtissbacteria bacterium]|nr:hypothetical protein [Candidatus Curtissbacteria bacterium]
MKKLSAITLALLFLIAGTTVLAKRMLPQARPASGSVSATRGVGTSVRFRGDRLAIIVNFSNLAVASSVSYALSYNTRGTTQGASGTINPTNSPDPLTRELLFGTCSHGVCRYDTGLTNARFVVTTVLKNGRRVVKSFRLRV